MATKHVSRLNPLSEITAIATENNIPLSVEVPEELGSAGLSNQAITDYVLPLNSQTVDLFKMVATISSSEFDAIQKKRKKSHRSRFESRIFPCVFCVVCNETEKLNKSVVMRLLHGNVLTSDQLSVENNSSVRTLSEALQSQRRLTMRNIIKWSHQLMGSIHTLHSKFMTMGNLNLESIYLLSDKSVTDPLCAAIRQSQSILKRGKSFSSLPSSMMSRSASINNMNSLRKSMSMSQKNMYWPSSDDEQSDGTQTLRSSVQSGSASAGADSGAPSLTTQQAEVSRDAWIDPLGVLLQGTAVSVHSELCNAAQFICPAGLVVTPLSTMNSPVSFSPGRMLRQQFSFAELPSLGSPSGLEASPQHLGLLEASNSHTMRDFSALQEYDLGNSNVCTLKDEDVDVSATTALFGVWSLRVQHEMRALGILILQMILHRQFNELEMRDVTDLYIVEPPPRQSSNLKKTKKTNDKSSRPSTRASENNGDHLDNNNHMHMQHHEEYAHSGHATERDNSDTEQDEDDNTAPAQAHTHHDTQHSPVSHTNHKTQPVTTHSAAKSHNHKKGDKKHGKHNKKNKAKGKDHGSDDDEIAEEYVPNHPPKSSVVMRPPAVAHVLSDMEKLDIIVPQLLQVPSYLRKLVHVLMAPLEAHSVKEYKGRSANSTACELRLKIFETYRVQLGIIGDAVDELSRGTRFVKPVYWTDELEEERLTLIDQRKDELAEIALQGVKAANKRVHKDKAQLWFDLQPKDVQEVILRKKDFRSEALANKKQRAALVRKASFHNWDCAEMSKWLKSAIMGCFKKAKETKKEADTLLLQGQRPDVFKEQVIKETYEPFVAVISKTLNFFGVQCLTIDPNASAYEFNQDLHACAKILSVEISRGLAESMDCLELSKGIRASISNAEVKMSRNALNAVLAEALLQIKRTTTESEMLTKELKHLRNVLSNFANEIMLMDRVWITKMALMVCIAVIQKYNGESWVRTKGEDLAAARLCGFARMIKTKKLVKAVWIKARVELYQIMEKEKEDRKKRISSGETVEGDILDSDAIIQNAQTLESKNAVSKTVDLEEIKLTEIVALAPVEKVPTEIACSIDVHFTINLFQSNFGVVEGKRNHVVCTAAVVKEPDVSEQFCLKQGLLVKHKHIQDTHITTIDSHDLQAILSNNSPDRNHHKSDLNTNYSPDCGEILVILYDNRHMTDTMTVIRSKTEEYNGPMEPMPILSRTNTGSSYSEGRHLKLLASTVAYVGCRQPEWSRADFLRRAEAKSAGYDDKIKSELDEFSIVLYGLRPNCRYRVTMLTCDLFHPRQPAQRRPYDNTEILRPYVVGLRAKSPTVDMLIVRTQNWRPDKLSLSDIHCELVEHTNHPHSLPLLQELQHKMTPLKGTRPNTRTKSRNSSTRGGSACSTLNASDPLSDLRELLQPQFPFAAAVMPGEKYFDVVWTACEESRVAIPQAEIRIHLTWKNPRDNGSALIGHRVQRRVRLCQEFNPELSVTTPWAALSLDISAVAMPRLNTSHSTDVQDDSSASVYTMTTCLTGFESDENHAFVDEKSKVSPELRLGCSDQVVFSADSDLTRPHLSLNLLTSLWRLQHGSSTQSKHLGSMVIHIEYRMLCENRFGLSQYSDVLSASVQSIRLVLAGHKLPMRKNRGVSNNVKTSGDVDQLQLVKGGGASGAGAVGSNCGKKACVIMVNTSPVLAISQQPCLLPAISDSDYLTIAVHKQLNDQRDDNNSISSQLMHRFKEQRAQARSTQVLGRFAEDQRQDNSRKSKRIALTTRTKQQLTAHSLHANTRPNGSQRASLAVQGLLNTITCATNPPELEIDNINNNNNNDVFVPNLFGLFSSPVRHLSKMHTVPMMVDNVQERVEEELSQQATQVLPSPPASRGGGARSRDSSLQRLWGGGNNAPSGGGGGGRSSVHAQAKPAPLTQLAVRPAIAMALSQGAGNVDGDCSVNDQVEEQNEGDNLEDWLASVAKACPLG